MNTPVNVKLVEDQLGTLMQYVSLSILNNQLVLEHQYMLDVNYTHFIDILNHLGFKRMGSNRFIRPLPLSPPHHLPLEERRLINIEDIELPKFLVRSSIDEAVVQERAEDIKIHGIINPIKVRPKGDKYELAAGGYRLISAKQAGFTEIEVTVREMDDREMVEIGLSENLHRQPLSDYDVARTLKHLLTTFPDDFPTYGALAKKFGKSESWVTRHLDMLKLEHELPPELLTRMTEGLVRVVRTATEDERPAIIQHLSETFASTGEFPSMEHTAQQISATRNLNYIASDPALLPLNITTVLEFDCPVCGHHHLVKCDHEKDWVE